MDVGLLNAAEPLIELTCTTLGGAATKPEWIIESAFEDRKVYLLRELAHTDGAPAAKKLDGSKLSCLNGDVASYYGTMPHPPPGV
jgi:hypothetical protein